ncbi:MAG: GNAT family N-acetyltransferase [Vicinamibacterales bacterium]|nr:GNAT family N-acetyltransferase [Vicinamibacterales bacterium]
MAPASIATDRLVLRDGSTAGMRLASPSDRAAIEQFFNELSPESRRLRFLAPARASANLIDQLCDNSAPRHAVTLLVCRQDVDGARIVGVGSYFAISDASAEVAFAVDDRFHGKGIATALLERLAEIASANAIQSFDASVLDENYEMLDVFRDSGFEVRSTNDRGCVDVRLSLVRSDAHTRASDERDRLATIASLAPMLMPRAVAVIGASRDENNLGRRVFEALRAARFAGPIYPVNPAVSELHGVRCYASARALPPGVDLAVIVVPRTAVLATIDDCAAAGIKAVVVISAGFAECGDEGRALQDRLVEQVRGYGMRMLGPNCMGLFNVGRHLNASFAESLPPAGRIALASQSGGLGLAILNIAATRQIGLSAFASLGNKADVSGNDFLQYAESDPATSVILLYLESFGNPRRFGQIARRVSRTKPIVVVKAGRSDAGTRAAASHTAGLAASDVAVDGLFHQSGVIRANTIDEMFDIAACLDGQPLPPGRRVAIVTNAGGPGILAADACAASGLDVLPTAASLTNPVDLIASAGAADYRRTIEALLTAEDVDAVMAIYTSIDSRQTGEILDAIADGVKVARRRGFVEKPIVFCMMATAPAGPLRAGDEVVPVYPFPEHAARALGKAANYALWRSLPQGSYPVFADAAVQDARRLCREIVDTRGQSWLTPEELHRLLNLLGLPTTTGVVANNAEEAAALARVLGFPVAAKIVSPKAIHKTELDGVRLHLNNEAAVRSAYAELVRTAQERLGSSPDGVLIQPMVKGGTETLIGVTHDALFGPLVAFGLGGANVEVFRDVAFRIAPLTNRDADELLRSIKGFRLLQGYRGHAPADLPTLRDLLLRVAYVADQVPELLELEFNPVMALAPGLGCQIVDARARVG